MMGIAIGVMGGACKADVEDTISADQFEMDAIEVGADGVKPLIASHSAGEFHTRLFQAKDAQSSLGFILDHPTEDGLMR